MAAYFRRRAGTCTGGPLADDPYPALMVAGSAAAGGEGGGGGDVGQSSAVEKVYEFSPGPRDDDVIDCCPRHYQMALIDAQRAQPSLETFRPASDSLSAAGLGECCPLVNAQHRYGAATTAVLRLHDRRR